MDWGGEKAEQKAGLRRAGLMVTTGQWGCEPHPSTMLTGASGLPFQVRHLRVYQLWSPAFAGVPRQFARITTFRRAKRVLWTRPPRAGQAPGRDRGGGRPRAIAQAAARGGRGSMCRPPAG